MSIQAVAWAIRARVGDQVLKLVLIALANYANDDWQSWPKIKTLAADAECSTRTIQRALVRLSEAGFVRIEQQFDDKNGRQRESKIHLLCGEGDNLSPPKSVTPSMTPSVTPPMTESCHGPGDSKVSPLNEPSQEPLQEPLFEPSLSVASEALACPSDWPPDFENQWWKTYPRREDKKPAMRSLNKIAKMGKTTWAELLEGTQHYASHMAGKETRFIKLPATFLNAESWKNRYTRNHERPKSFFDAAAQSFEQAHDARTDKNGW